MATSPLPSWGPKEKRKCYVTLAFSKIPNAKRREQNQKCSATIKRKIRNGCPTTTFPEGQRKAQMLLHPCNLRDPQDRGTKFDVATTTVPSRGPKRGQKCYVTPPFSVIPNKMCGEQNQKRSPTKKNKIRSGCRTPAFLEAQKRAGMLLNPCILGVPHRQPQGAKSEMVPNKTEQNQKWLPHPCLLGGRKQGGNATSPPAFSGSPDRDSKKALTTPVEKDPSERGTR